MDLQSYIPWTATTAVYPKDREHDYLALGLISELGELAAMLKREMRDGVTLWRPDALREAGDICWYLARMHPDVGVWLSQAEAAYPSRLEYAPAAICGMASRIHSASCLRKFFELLGCLRFTMYEVIDCNVEKLESRKERGVLQGVGDAR